jgi:hypothetical protein
VHLLACWQWSVRRPVEVDIKVTRKSGSVFNGRWSSTQPLIRRASVCIVTARPVALPGTFLSPYMALRQTPPAAGEAVGLSLGAAEQSTCEVEAVD